MSVSGRKPERTTTATRKPSLPASGKSETVTTIERRDGNNTRESKFAIRDVITVPTTIADTGKATIVGREWGPDNLKLRGSGWVFYISIGHGPAWIASEEELIKWGNG
jgi:hypothetical protein